MAKPRKKSPRLPRQTKATPSRAQNGDLFRIVAETATDIIATIDEQSRILFINSAVERILGYPAKELVGREITILMPDYLRELHRAAIGKYLATGQRHFSWAALALTGLHRTGREVPLEVSIGEQVQGGKHIFTGIIRDVSERQRIEEELRQSNEKYARMIQSSPDAITRRTLPERRYLEVNEGFCRMTGYTAEEVIGKTSAELSIWPDPGRRVDTLERILREGEVHEEEFRFRPKSGSLPGETGTSRRVSRPSRAPRSVPQLSPRSSSPSAGGRWSSREFLTLMWPSGKSKNYFAVYRRRYRTDYSCATRRKHNSN